MSKSGWSETDLVNKWGRKLTPGTARSLPWDVLRKLVLGLSDDTKLPREALLAHIRARSISGLFDVASNLDVTVYTSPDLLLQDRLVCELFSKFDFVESPFNKREKAELRFFEAEERCRETNFRVGRLLDLPNDVNAVIHRAQRYIERVLGNFDLNKMLGFCRFGPGASLCVSGPYTTEYFKLCEKSPTVGSDAFPYAEALLACDHKWRGHLLGVHPFDVAGPFSPVDGLGVELTEVNYNKVTFVPKNAKTDRSIAIEPYFNVYFQLGLGALIRERLYKRCGINLDSQVRNQALALKGSMTGQLATIDFSMASDTISRETVRLLIAPTWFDHLDRLRSKNYKLGGSCRPYQKFSSMGNGYTFELETLIFHSLALAACEELDLDTTDITVYGDDVILPVGGCVLYEKVCNYLGFKVNEEKSFSSGSFRESCGEDYLNGVRVRPVFCKELDTVQHVASLANRLFELNRSVGVGSRVNDMLRNAVGLLHSRIPRDVCRLVVGPPSEDMDGYIHTEEIERLAASELVRWVPDFCAWEHPRIHFCPRVMRRHKADAALWINWGAAVKRRAIPKPHVLLDKLHSLPSKIAIRDHCGRIRQRTSELTDFLQEVVPREITGREIGELVLGRSLGWVLAGSYRGE